MFRRVLRLWGLLALVLVGNTAAASLQSARRPIELVLIRQDSKCTIMSIRETQHHKSLSNEPGSFVVENPRSHTSSARETQRIKVYSYDESVLSDHARSICADWDTHLELEFTQYLLQKSFSNQQPLMNEKGHSPPLKIERLIESGPSENRVDLVFFSDGYTTDEYGLFIRDATRLAQDVSSNQTFHTVKPLLNFWAAFSPSEESGIGKGGIPKDTPYGLYRDGTELRGIYYSKPEVARAACLSMGDRCDYPILLGNDPQYGGLGGEFTVITPSLANGALVLRHELGHSMIEVGEEYDGGFAYYGVNAAHNVSSLPWSHWLSHSHHGEVDAGSAKLAPRVERSVMPMQAYPWTPLNTSSSWSIAFDSSGTYSRHLVKFSLSGIPSVDDLVVLLDGIDLGWVPRKDIGVDRWHYDFWRESGLSAGAHELSFVLKIDREGVAQLCSVEVLEFGDEAEFISAPGHYSVYPTYSENNETSYRPTNRDCLMRAVTTPNLCNACLEGLWLSLFKRVDLIDDIREGCSRTLYSEGHLTEFGAKWTRTLELHLVPLAQFRDVPVESKERYSIYWKKDGVSLAQYENQTRIALADEEAMGTYTVDVIFTTEEVRHDGGGLLTAKAEYVVDTKCPNLQ